MSATEGHKRRMYDSCVQSVAWKRVKPRFGGECFRQDCQRPTIQRGTECAYNSSWGLYYCLSCAEKWIENDEALRRLRLK